MDVVKREMLERKRDQQWKGVDIVVINVPFFVYWCALEKMCMFSNGGASGCSGQYSLGPQKQNDLCETLLMRVWLEWNKVLGLQVILRSTDSPCVTSWDKS